jgi:Flp pilus assembly pilin Flp
MSVIAIVDYYRARFRAGEHGATATEYAVVVGLIVAALVIIAGLFTDILRQLWCGMIDSISTIPGFSITPPADCGA